MYQFLRMHYVYTSNLSVYAGLGWPTPLIYSLILLFPSRTDESALTQISPGIRVHQRALRLLPGSGA
jgi:hypothetical protein